MHMVGPDIYGVQAPFTKFADLSNNLLDDFTHLRRQNYWFVFELLAPAFIEQGIVFMLSGIAFVLAVTPAALVAVEPRAVCTPGNELG